MKFKYGDKVQVKETGQVGVVDAVFGKPPAYTLKGFSPAKPYYEENELVSLEKPWYAGTAMERMLERVRVEAGEGIAITGPTETFPYWVKVSPREMFASPTMYDLLTFLKEHKGKGEIKVHQNATTDIPFIMGQVEKMKRGEKLDEEKWSKTTPKPLEVQEKEFAEIKPEKPEEQVKLTPENIEWAIDETLTHYAEDWLKRSVRALLEEGKRDEALKFLREHCRYFGVASPGKPYVSGSEKGILITSAIMKPEETKLITWVELLKRVEAEKIKRLEEY